MAFSLESISFPLEINYQTISTYALFEKLKYSENPQEISLGDSNFRKEILTVGDSRQETFQSWKFKYSIKCPKEKYPKKNVSLKIRF